MTVLQHVMIQHPVTLVSRRGHTLGLRRELDMPYLSWNAGSMSRRGMSPMPTKLCLEPPKAHYKQFKDAWSYLELDTNKIHLLDWEEFCDQTFLVERARQSLAWVEWYLLQNTPKARYVTFLL